MGDREEGSSSPVKRRKTDRPMSGSTFAEEEVASGGAAAAAAPVVETSQQGTNEPAAPQNSENQPEQQQEGRDPSPQVSDSGNSEMASEQARGRGNPPNSPDTPHVLSDEDLDADDGDGD
ncbi:hypothetical protein MGN70_003189 [Eutypa lata]|uniref:Uncharacterized protein n=1 Tax=Eutypa lata (strain UCR-EL1) TaxID=1287681 RepID=M7TPF8_EUTLA|nr:hypothetical protein UCREL1_4394 [Eutypa lata UCREL1]KAI1255126.1 hypothetical protein MGN70_003189 [Eutypa lata]